MCDGLCAQVRGGPVVSPDEIGDGQMGRSGTGLGRLGMPFPLCSPGRLPNRCYEVRRVVMARHQSPRTMSSRMAAASSAILGVSGRCGEWRGLWRPVSIGESRSAWLVGSREPNLPLGHSRTRVLWHSHEGWPRATHPKSNRDFGGLGVRAAGSCACASEAESVSRRATSCRTTARGTNEIGLTLAPQCKREPNRRDSGAGELGLALAVPHGFGAAGPRVTVTLR
jgi:hypothetical protein